MANLLFVVGSTGGHLYPALSISQYCYKYNHSCVILAPKSVEKKLKLENQDIYFQNDLYIKSPFFLLDFLKNINISLKILENKKIDAVVSFGSISSIPASIIGKIKHRKLIVVDQNTLPGRTTRFLSTFSNLVIIPFEESKKYIKSKNVIVMLSPIREEFINLERGKEDTLLFFGGSLGSRTINKLALEMIRKITPHKIKHVNKIVVITGNRFFTEFQNEITKIKELKELEINSDELKFIKENWMNISIYKYCSNIANIYKDSALVISRSGGSTLAELLYLRKRALLIPYPYAMDNHQLYNAQIASEYANFIDYIQEPIDLDKSLEKIDRLINTVPQYKKTINFFNYDEFFEKIKG